MWRCWPVLLSAGMKALWTCLTGRRAIKEQRLHWDHRKHWPSTSVQLMVRDGRTLTMTYSRSVFVLTVCLCVLGSVFSVDEQARSVALLSVESAVQKMWYSKRRGVLAVVTESLLLSQFTLGPEGFAEEISKVTANQITPHIQGFYENSQSDCKIQTSIRFFNGFSFS